MTDAGWGDRTFRSAPATPEELVRAKHEGSHRITVALPALDEAATIGSIIETIKRDLIEEVPFVDELLVIDSGSVDETVAVARAAGATVYLGTELTDAGAVRGKGDCLWRSLVVATGDIIVWLDSDTRNLNKDFVLDLVAPLLLDERFVLTKAFYDRPLVTDEQVLMTGGARVTEIAARPLLQLLYPELTGLIQPLSGEYAGRTEMFRTFPFFTGYGVEVGILLDVAERFGVERIAQVDLGVRLHRNRSVLELGRASMQVISALLRRLDDLGRIKIPDGIRQDLLQFIPSANGPQPITSDLEVFERPPINEI